MTFSERGLLRAMKQQFKGYGYTVAQTENGLLICCDEWGVGIRDHLVTNGIKSLIMLHAGKLPTEGCAIYCQKDLISTKLYEMVVDRVRGLMCEKSSQKVLPARLTMDGMAVWQDPVRLSIFLVDPENQQICDFGDLDASVVDGALYGNTMAGVVYVECANKNDMGPMLHHLEQMQWTALNAED